ncbi:protein tyrosine phosphatase family protein [Salicola sp. Rm-C-2C1-2]|uniref:protein tyrosine phosphatase family protein n=1 Tax=Salicola sp. Rm-C-2C1-2 TaxID=3141321 RepID=UPI0032E41CA6
MKTNQLTKPALILGLALSVSLGVSGCAHVHHGNESPDASSVSQGALQRGQPFDTSIDAGMAPFGDVMTNAVANYNRPSPYIGTGGRVSAGAMPELKQMGFRTVVSLLTPEEGLSDEREAAGDAGLGFHGISVSGGPPTADQVDEFARIVSEQGNYPILMHCASGNRAGAMWALYRHQVGVSAEIALEEGRAVGLDSLEPGVRERLGLGASD